MGAACFAGFAPTTEIVTNPEMLYLALGIIGATVMPHNLYLHSGIVQTRAYGDDACRRSARRCATPPSIRRIALMFALTINASILILAAATFHTTGNTGVEELDRRTSCSARCSARRSRRRLFAIALLCCGLNSTVTATMAGQIVMEGFLNIRLPAWLAAADHARRRDRAGGRGDDLLRRQRHRQAADPVSQVILSLQLPFAVVPLVMFTASRGKMGALVAPRWLTAVAAVVAAIIVVLNVKLIVDFVIG